MYLKIKRQTESFYGVLPGTMQETLEKVSLAIREKFADNSPTMSDADRTWVNMIGTFPDRVVFSRERGKTTNYYVAGWSVASDGTVTLQPETEIKITFVAQPTDGDGKVVAMESGRRNSRNDEESLLSIVEQAVYLLGKDKVLEKVKTCRQGPNVEEDDEEAMESCKPKMRRKL